MKRKPLILLGIFAVLAAALLGGWAWVHFSAAKGIDFGEAEIAELVVYQGNEEVARVTDRGKIESFVQLFSDKNLRDDLLCQSRAATEEDREAARRDGCIEVILTGGSTRFTADESWSSHMRGQDGFDRMVLTAEGLFLYREEDGGVSACYPAFLGQPELYQRAAALLLTGGD